MHGDTRPLRLGMHTYTLHFFGFGESWGFGKDYYFDQVMTLEELFDLCEELQLDGVQLTKVDLLATGAKDPFGDENLHAVAESARKHGLFLKFNSSFKAGSDSRVNCTVEEALHIGHELGAELVKFSLDEPIESAREREMAAFRESIRYLRDVCGLGVRGR